MTSAFKAIITHNHPVTVSIQDSQFSVPRIIHQTEGEPGLYHGQKELNVDQWFSGPQRIIIKETPKPESAGE